MCDTLKMYSDLHEVSQLEKDNEDAAGGKGRSGGRSADDIEGRAGGNRERADMMWEQADGIGGRAEDIRDDRMWEQADDGGRADDIIDAAEDNWTPAGGPDEGVDFENDDKFEEYMDRLYRGGAEDEDEDEDYDDFEVLAGNYTGDVCIVHVNGVHHLPVLTCGCRGQEQVALDMAHSRFLPTSFSRLSTMFTMAVLDDFRLANLECKASGYQYWQRLRRMTRPLGPDQVVDRYKELLRMARLWRWMKKLKWAGFGQDADKTAQSAADGELTTFCPACPQPGINIPDDWQDHEDK
jgi:hypothetical protein